MILIHFVSLSLLHAVMSLTECYRLSNRWSHYDSHYDYEPEAFLPGSRMWNGSITSWQKYPFFAHLVIQDSKQDYLCSGALVTSEVVITAGHCFEPWDRKLSHVSVWYHVSDTSHSNPEAIEYPVKAVFVHPDYKPNPSIRYDFALVHIGESRNSKLPEMMIGNYLFLPEPEEDKKFISQVMLKYVTALAMGSSFGDDQGKVLKEAKVVLSEKCGYLGKEFDPQHEVCTSETRMKFQPGDSGGPIFAETDRGSVIIAVMSRRFMNDKDPVDVTTHARVSSVISWLIGTIRNNTGHHGLDLLYEKWKTWFDWFPSSNPESDSLKFILSI